MAFHEQGIKGTTIANIAERAGIPVGNVYYYFKTKDAFAAAVIAHYRDEMQSTFAKLSDDPVEALREYVSWSLKAPSVIASLGCERATLCADLARVGSELAGDARDLVAEELSFVVARVGEDRSDLATELVAQVHGIKALCHALGQRSLVERLGVQLHGWIRARVR